MAEGSVFEDYLWLIKAREDSSLLIRALILTRLRQKNVNDETILELKDRFMRKTVEEKMDIVIHALASLRGLKYGVDKSDGVRLHYEIRTQDAWKNELYVTLNDLIQYEAKLSTGWAEKQRKEYLDLSLSKKISAMEFYEDLKMLREKGGSFEDSGKILANKYSSLTLYRPQKRTHYLEGVLSANPNESKETTDYCSSLELSQIISDSGQKNVKAVLTVNTKWNFIKKN